MYRVNLENGPKTQRDNSIKMIYRWQIKIYSTGRAGESGGGKMETTVLEHQ